MKMVVPGGFMLGTSGGSFTIELCSGHGPETVVVEMPGLADHGDHKDGHGKTEMPCAFAGLSAPSLAATDAVLLAAAIVFIVAAVPRGIIDTAMPERPAYLRPRCKALQRNTDQRDTDSCDRADARRWTSLLRAVLQPCSRTRVPVAAGDTVFMHKGASMSASHVTVAIAVIAIATSTASAQTAAPEYDLADTGNL